MTWWAPREPVAAVRLAAALPLLGAAVSLVLPWVTPDSLGPYPWMPVVLHVAAPLVLVLGVVLVVRAAHVPACTTLLLDLGTILAALTANLLTHDTSFGGQIYLLVAPVIAAHHLRGRAAWLVTGVAVSADALLLGVLEGSAGLGRDLPAFTLLAVGVVALVLRARRRHFALLEELHRRAGHDDLTGLATRRVLEAALEQALAGPSSCAVVLADVDDFTAVNDRGGHEGGDAALRAVADRLLALRLDHPELLAARLGGDEMVLLVPDNGPDVAVGLARQLRGMVAGAAELLRTGNPVTLSVGVAGSCPGDDPATLLARADRALYAAKAAGRDRVEAGTGVPPPRSAAASVTHPTEGRGVVAAQ
ncbi:GGDEF domain-containing protein [Kineococcus gynurae]|uniref:GGDEF domain-containing protein n=1 Tax=Kineococcus gynurae TaxID=452979 RepID=A0ABV5LVX7_9ACTN